MTFWVWTRRATPALSRNAIKPTPNVANISRQRFYVFAPSGILINDYLSRLTYFCNYLFTSCWSDFQRTCGGPGRIRTAVRTWIIKVSLSPFGCVRNSIRYKYKKNVNNNSVIFGNFFSMHYLWSVVDAKPVPKGTVNQKRRELFSRLFYWMHLIFAFCKFDSWYILWMLPALRRRWRP